MAIYIARGCFTNEYIKRLVAEPEDREPAIKKLVEAAGGKLIAFFFTSGETDFELIFDGKDDDLLSAMMFTASAGMITSLKTVRAWSGADIKKIAKKSGSLGKSYHVPGKK